MEWQSARTGRGAAGATIVSRNSRQVGHVGREIVDMTLAAVGQGPVGEALAAPVHGIDRKAAVQQLAHDLGRVLLDELAAAGQDDDRAARGSRDVPDRIAQARAGAAPGNP